MKNIITILCLLAVARSAGAEEDPFAVKSKNLVDLVQCANGHKTLHDVKMIYGHGAGRDPETAAKIDRGEAMHGGCMGGPDHLVFCKTCGLYYDDNFDSWRDDRHCSVYELRLIRSPFLQGFPIAHAIEAEGIEYIRWYGREALQGEWLSFWTTGEDKDIVAALTRWAPDTVKIVAPDPQSDNDKSRNSWEWIADGKCFELDYEKAFGKKSESFLQIKWHPIAEQAAPSDGDKPSN
jgi:hypothetical protein